MAAQEGGGQRRPHGRSHIYPLQAVMAEVEPFFQLLLQLCSLLVYSFSELLDL